MQRGEFADELLRDPLAFALLAVIAGRARYSPGESLHGLTFGQALIGDWRQYGMTEKEYRGAKLRLARFGLAKFAPSPKGTVATLCDSRVFSLKDERTGLEKGGCEVTHKGGQFSEEKTPNRAGTRAGTGAGKGQSEGGQGATNTEGKKEKTERSYIASAADALPPLFVLPDIPDMPDMPFEAEIGRKRERNPIVDALAACGGSDPLQVPPRAWGAIAAALADIRAVCPGVTPSEIHRRSINYRTHMRDALLSPSALAKNWALCDRPAEHHQPVKGRALFA